MRRYADEGKIKSIKNPAGQRLYMWNLMSGVIQLELPLFATVGELESEFNLL
ncbi:hypothetical protein [Cylindrospermopsis curvispora]|uniref:hypothetical protein n=1 Tax=Cylindrospermopsis curvispora TaxID=747548 RepID=UPI001F245BA1|nr:hypothetical protein [Cylindrospermopsis curvispora]